MKYVDAHKHKKLTWYELAVDGAPPELTEDEQLIVTDGQGEIRPAFLIQGVFIGYIVEPVTHWMIISKARHGDKIISKP
jgi:hypothetical protein